MNHFEPAKLTTLVRELHFYAKDGESIKKHTWPPYQRPVSWRFHWCKYDDYVQGDDGRDWLTQPKGEHRCDTFDSAYKLQPVLT